MSHLYMNLFFVIYQGSVKPLNSRFNNQVELFNEYLLGCCSFYALCFTDWVPSKADQAMYGYHQLALVFVLIFYNVCIILYFSGRSIMFLIFKGNIRLTHNFELLKIKIMDKFEKKEDDASKTE